VVGWESVTVPAGTFRALHVTTGDGGEVWASRDVPFGLVKTHGKQGDLALTGRGAEREVIHHGEAPGDAWDADAQRLKRCPCGFGLCVLTWVTLFHTP